MHEIIVYNRAIKRKEPHRMKQVTSIRKTVCIMANELKKAGYPLSEAFRKAWQRVKLSMTTRAAGCTFENRQERLGFLKRFGMEDLSVTLEREPKPLNFP